MSLKRKWRKKIRNGSSEYNMRFQGGSTHLKQSTVRYILINVFNYKVKKFHPMEKWSEVLKKSMKATAQSVHRHTKFLETMSECL